MEKLYDLSVFNSYSPSAIALALGQMVGNSEYVLVCVGSDRVIGDSLAPLVGTLLEKKGYKGSVYGMIGNTVTAKEINFLSQNINKIHPYAKVVAIDSAVGLSEDIGKIKLINKPILPGLAVRNDLLRIGDLSILGVVSAKSDNNYQALNLTSLKFIYKMSQVIADGILLFDKTRRAKKTV